MALTKHLQWCAQIYAPWVNTAILRKKRMPVLSSRSVTDVTTDGNHAMKKDTVTPQAFFPQQQQQTAVGYDADGWTLRHIQTAPHISIHVLCTDHVCDGDTVSAGVLCYAIPPDGEDIFFLLAKDRQKRGARWSHLGGGRHENETAQMAAAREFMEESLNVLDINLMPLPSPPAADNPEQQRQLYSGNDNWDTKRRQLQHVLESALYTLKITTCVNFGAPLTTTSNTDTAAYDDRTDAGGPVTALSATCTEQQQPQRRRHHVTYVLQVPWQPDIAHRYERKRRFLTDLHHRSMRVERLLVQWRSLNTMIQEGPSLQKQPPAALMNGTGSMTTKTSPQCCTQQQLYAYGDMHPTSDQWECVDILILPYVQEGHTTAPDAFIARAVFRPHERAKKINEDEQGRHQAREDVCAVSIDTILSPRAAVEGCSCCGTQALLLRCRLKDAYLHWLRECNALWQFYENLPIVDKETPAVQADSRRRCISLAAEHAEKDEIRWWSRSRLETVLSQGGVFDEVVHPGMIHSSQKQLFRPAFLPTLATALSAMRA